jgi:hypothetical protein
LDSLTDPGLATELAHRRLARLPPTPPESHLPGLRRGQRQAYACSAHPGTGLDSSFPVTPSKDDTSPGW